MSPDSIFPGNFLQQVEVHVLVDGRYPFTAVRKELVHTDGMIFLGVVAQGKSAGEIPLQLNDGKVAAEGGELGNQPRGKGGKWFIEREAFERFKRCPDGRGRV